jgi:hypothetical protein
MSGGFQGISSSKRLKFSGQVLGCGQSFGTCAQTVDNEKPLPTACTHSAHSGRVIANSQSDWQNYNFYDAKTANDAAGTRGVVG